MASINPGINPVVDLVFDIDGTLAWSKTSTIKHAAFFLKKSAILTAIRTHYIFPGVLELMQLLTSLEHVRLSFFSAGVHERNERLVELLLERAIGKEKFGQIKHDVRIVSRHDLVRPTFEESSRQFALYGIRSYETKKHLSKVVKEADKIPEAILIEDDETYSAHGQEKSLLKVPTTSEHNFERLESQAKAFDAQGYEKIGCSFIILTPYTDLEDIKEKVVHKKTIAIFKKGSTYEVGFLNGATHEYEQKPISGEDNKKLIEALNELKMNELISDPALIEEIHKIVNHDQGRTKKLCYAANHIYYLTGLLFKAMETAKEEKLPVSDILFRMQFKPHYKAHKPHFEQLAVRDELYELGLEKLRQVNANLTFTTPLNYMECINIDLTEAEENLLEEARSNENDECVIM
jgi:hypothetical protein